MKNIKFEMSEFFIVDREQMFEWRAKLLENNKTANREVIKDIDFIFAKDKQRHRGQQMAKINKNNEMEM